MNPVRMASGHTNSQYKIFRNNKIHFGLFYYSAMRHIRNIKSSTIGKPERRYYKIFGKAAATVAYDFVESLLCRPMQQQ